MLRRVLAVTATLTIALTGFLTVPPPSASAADEVLLPTGEVVPVEHVALVDGTFDAINDYREERGLEALRFAPDLFQVAQSWSDQMATSGTFDHRVAHWTLYPAGWGNVGEIIAARNDRDVRQLVQQWINSEGHERIMTSDVTVMGPGIALGGAGRYGMYGTVNFGEYAPDAIPSYESIGDWIADGGEVDRDDSVGDITRVEVAADGAITVTGWAFDFSDRTLASTVRLTLDGRSTASVVANRSIASWGAGEWRQGHDFRWTFAAEPGVEHEVCAVALNSYGAGQSRNLGCEEGFVALPDPEIPTERLDGANRYDTAVQISERYNGLADVDTVYLATGERYPDALSLAPAAAQPGNALLLTPRGSVLPVVLDELRRLDPVDVVIVGTEDSVSANAERQVARALPGADISRLDGENRYETSVLIAQHAFPNSTLAYIASGQVFPDALSAAPVAATRNAPVILTPGVRLPQSVSEYIDSSRLTEFVIAGGTPSVSSEVAGQLAALAGSDPRRIAGENRYETNRQLAATANSGVQTEVLLASGLGFPDALAGAAVAAGAGPLLLSRTTCVPAETVEIIYDEYLPETLVVLGGTPTLSPSAADLTRCG